MKKPLFWGGAVSLAMLLVAVPATAGANPPQSAQQPQMNFAMKVGVGLVVPYGVLGAGIDIGISNFSLVAGLGTALEGVGWSAGARYYFFNQTRRFRPHFTAVYGTTMIVDVMGGNGYTVNGFGFYASVDHNLFNPPGGLILTYGVGLITNEPPGPGVEDPRFSVKVMFGVNYRLGGRL
jgi:hypothetical protein